MWVSYTPKQMHTLGYFSVRTVYTHSVTAAPYSETWERQMQGKSWGSIVCKVSNTIPRLMRIIHHDIGVIWVEKQQLSNHNWNNAGLEGKNNYPDKITSNILKYVIPWVWLCWCKQIPYKRDPKGCSLWGNIDLFWYNLANAHEHTKYPGLIPAASIPSYDFESAINIS